MPRRGRHRTRLPFRLLAAVAALLVGGTAVVLGGTALAKGSDGGSIISSLTGSSKSDEGSSDDSSSDSGSSDGGSGDDKSGDKSGDGKDSGARPTRRTGRTPRTTGTPGRPVTGRTTGPRTRTARRSRTARTATTRRTRPRRPTTRRRRTQGQQGKKDDPFPGRDKIAAASGDDFVDIANVAPNGNRGEGGEFSGGTYTVDCGVSDHNNSDNYMAAPGKRNGAQHVHDYVGNTSTNANSSDDSLNAADTSCANGDKSTFFWPVLRDLNGKGPDVGQDGGSLDGNVGSILKPTSAQITYHGHGDEDGQGHADRTCRSSRATPRRRCRTARTPTPSTPAPASRTGSPTSTRSARAGSHLQRILDFPSCWDGQNLESKDRARTWRSRTSRATARTVSSRSRRCGSR